MSTYYGSSLKEYTKYLKIARVREDLKETQSHPLLYI